MGWTIAWRGNSWTDSDLTGQHLATLALISGDDRFESLDISEGDVRSYPSEGYMRLMHMLSAFVAVDASEGLEALAAGEALTQAFTEIQAAPAEEIIGSVSFSS